MPGAPWGEPPKRAGCGLAASPAWDAHSERGGQETPAQQPSLSTSPRTLVALPQQPAAPRSRPTSASASVALDKRAEFQQVNGLLDAAAG